MTFKTAVKYFEDNLQSCKELLVLLKKVDALEREYAEGLTRAVLDFRSAVGKDKAATLMTSSKKLSMNPMLKIIGKRQSGSGSLFPMAAKEKDRDEELFDGLGGSLWACIFAMTEDMLTTAVSHQSISTKIQESILAPFVENIGLVEEQVKNNTEIGKKTESLKKSEIGKQEEVFVADEMAKVFQNFQNIEEWRQQIVKKVVDEYAELRLFQTDIVLNQCVTISTALRNVDLGEDIQDFIEDHVSLNRSAKSLDWVHSGPLEKGGETISWKPRFFGLKDEQQKLYYFRGDVKGESQAIKGVIDLPKMKLFDVHESYMAKPHCFQLIPCNEDGVATESFDKTVFLAAETAEEKKTWMQYLAKYCCWKAGPSRSLEKVHFVSFGHVDAGKPNIVRTLSIQLLDGLFTASSLHRDPDIYCVIKLGPAHMAKSSVCIRTITPAWNEIFSFKGVHNSVQEIEILVKSKRLGIANKTVDMGKVVLRLSDLEDVNQKHVCELMPASNAPFRGALKVRCTVEDLRVLPLSEYSVLWDLLAKHDAASLELLSRPFVNDMEPFTKALFGVLHGSGGVQVVSTALVEMLRHEIVKTVDSSITLRSNTMPTKLMELFLKEVGAAYLKLALGEVLTDICTKNEVLELDPNKADSPAVLAASPERLCQLIHLVWKSIQESAEYCPREIKDVLRKLMESVADPTLKYRIVSSLFFLRYLGVAILSPVKFGIVKVQPSPSAFRTLTLISKTLLWLSNYTKEAPKETYLENFITNHLVDKPDIRSFVDSLTQTSEAKKGIEAKLSPNLNLCLAEMHTLLYKEEKRLTNLANETNSQYLISVNGVTKEICQKLRVFDAVSPAGFHQYDEAAKARAATVMNPRMSVKLPPAAYDDASSFTLERPVYYGEGEEGGDVGVAELAGEEALGVAS